MNTKLTRVAAILAFAIGAMAIFAGGKVLLGQNPGYYVIDWVPVYNFSMGVITVVVSVLLIWKNSKLALPAAVTVLSSHAVVMAVLQTGYSDVVAPDSIQAMTLRITVWSIILSLLLAQAWKNRALRAKSIQVPG